MKIDRWIRLGALSLALASGISAAAEEGGGWRPDSQSMSPAVGMAPMPVLPMGMNDARFRPVPHGRWMMRPRPPAPYPGRPFVSVQGQYTPPPAFVRQYAWRPADRPADFYRPPRIADSYAPPGYPLPLAPLPPPPPAMPYGPFAATMYPGPMGVMPPPPMPYPPFPGMGPAPYPAGPYAGMPAGGYPPPLPPPYPLYPVWGGQPYAGILPMGYGYPPLPAPWDGAWSSPSAAWGARMPERRGLSRYGARGPLGSGTSLAGLY